MLPKWTFVIGVLSVASLLAGPLLSELRVLSPIVGFGLTSAGGAFGIFGLVVGIVAVMRGQGAAARPGLIVCGIVALFSLGFVAWARRYPPINDISTDTAHPPEFIHALSLPPNHGRNMDYPGEAFARRQTVGYPDLRSLALLVPPAQAFALVEKTARAMPRWTITDVEPESRRIEGVAETPLFRFLDDFVIEVRAADNGSVVEMRSKSREGRGDLGVNAQRIYEFFTALRQHVPL
jgi:uncharacterized protein (DUF1499 family)